MKLAEKERRLRHIRPFLLLDPARLKFVAYASQSREYEDGDTLIRQGDPGDAVYVVLEGTVEIIVGTNTQARAVRRLDPPVLVGEIAPLEGRPRTATVVARGPVLALRLERNVFRQIAEDAPTLIEAMQADAAAVGYVFE